MLIVKQIVNRVFASNTYVISSEGSLDYWLVDVGDFEEVLHILPSGANVKGVFLTHTHFDHIYGINDLHGAFPHCDVYTSEYGKEALYSEKKNFSFYHERPIIFEGKRVTVLQEGDAISLYPFVELKVYYTPGHCPSCLTYVVDNKLFTGDSFIPDVKVVSKLPRGNKELAKASEQRIINLSIGKDVYSVHGNIINNYRRK